MVVALTVAALTSGCVTPAIDAASYAEKARLSAEDAASELRTALLAVQAWLDGSLPATYLEVSVVESESALGAVASTFGSVQPPHDARSDRLSRQVGPQLGDAADALADLRVAVRRGDRQAVRDAVDSIRDLAEQLEHAPGLAQ